MQKHCHIISHTHWDREWYLPLEKFRIRLVRLIDNLLQLIEEEPSYIFHLDAQTIVLDDYLEVRPQRRPELERAIRAGNLLIGPWYIQNDFFLSSTESTVRNLLIGTRSARRWGGGEQTGYAPDQFGLPAQLPQLLSGFGLIACVFARGRRVPDGDNGRRVEFLWRAGGETEVLGIHLIGFYNNFQRVSADPARAERLFQLAMARLEPATATSHYLLMNGCDHLEAQEDLHRVLPPLRDRLPDDTELKQSTLDHYCRCVISELENPEIFEGELRETADRMLIQGTLSSRSAVKRAMFRAERLLAGQLEPLSAMLLALGFPATVYDAGFLEYLWKLLLQNLPHDSICGCSCDPVFRHMADRLARFHEMAETLLAEQLNRLLRRIEPDRDPAEYKLVAVNPLPGSRDETVTAEIDLKRDEQIAGFRLFAPDGAETPFEILDRRPAERAVRSPINLPARIAVDRYRIRFRTSLPPFGYRCFRVIPTDAMPVYPIFATANGRGLENEFLKLEAAPDGRITLTDKRTGKVCPDLVHFEDIGDFGDSYTMRPNPALSPVDSRDFTPEITAEKTSLVLRWQLAIPAFGHREEQRRAAETVALPLMLTLTLTPGSPRLAFEVEGDNRADDHALKIVIDPAVVTRYSVAADPGGSIRRDREAIRPEPRLDEEDPAWDFVLLDDGNAAAALLPEGIHAFHHRADGAVAFILLRANGYVQAYYETPLDPDWIAPENQCRGPFTGRLGLALLPGGATAGEVAQEAAQFLTPVMTGFDSCDPKKFTGGRPSCQDSEVGEIFHRPELGDDLVLPAESSLLAVAGVAPRLEAVKKAEESDELIVRLTNLDPLPAAGTLRLNFPADRVRTVNLAEEERGAAIEPDGDGYQLAWKAGEILSLAIRKKARNG